MEGYRIDFERPSHVYFIGIGGVSMSGLAEILIRKGFLVSGSDAAMSDLTEHLTECGAHIYCGQKRENIPEEIDFAVYTAAIRSDNPEYVACLERGIPLLSRAELLGQMMRKYRNSIAVSGTHGKTGTTSMLAHILIAADTDPTISVGGMLPLIGGNIRVGGDDMMLLEACEYTNSFLSFCPSVEIILNIEADHLDFFKDLDDIRNSFRRFVKRLPMEGTLVIDNRITNYEEIVGDFSGRVVTCGGEEAEVYAADISFDAQGCPSFTPVVRNQRRERIRLLVPGLHNVYNALAAIAAADSLGICEKDIEAGLLSYTGASRRFEKKGVFDGVTVVDDYAHHPQEIQATLLAAKQCPHKKLWCVFQPHTYTRTKMLLEGFAEALCQADHVILADIYAAREIDTLGISSEILAERINQRVAGKAVFFPTFDQIEAYLREHLSAGDLCITMGAGDVYRIGEHLLGK